MMTTVTTILGLFPLALGIGEGSEFLQPLGIVVFSGMAISTVLTLLIIPCFYLLLHDWRWDWAKPLWTRVRIMLDKRAHNRFQKQQKYFRFQKKHTDFKKDKTKR